ncbi:glyoxalase [Sphingomonas sp. HDW15A]|uniref:VOC family protein n=1 Tax=Sphingomonas sp. HDW15A TaxID=2714942 RepID=UPI00140BA9E9|nr:VOC family protein [Sphingomonas sp. HDW15A]QIK95478.1 glyoxalase [Sphingomonas sp. HDW15A]
MQLDHLVILVRSLERSLPWYGAMLGAMGFDKTRDHVWWNGTVAIDLKQADHGTPDYQRRAPGLNHLGFTAPDRAAFDGVRAAMSDAGFDVPQAQQFGKELATFFKDPEGMRIEVTLYS